MFFGDTFGAGRYMVTHGRAIERCIYRVTLEGGKKAPGAKLATKPAPLPTFPRSKETDALAEKAEQPQPIPAHLPAFPKEPQIVAEAIEVAPPPSPDKEHLPAFPRDPARKTVHRVGSTHADAKPAKKKPAKKPAAKKRKRRSKKKTESE